jgi:signal transduction histidine kinase
MPIRVKLIAALAPPLVTLVLVTVLEVAGALRGMRAVRDQTTLTEASLGPLNMLRSLQFERNAATVNLVGLQDAVTLDIEDDTEARRLTDESVAALRARVGRLQVRLQAAYDDAFQDLRLLADTRADIDAYHGPRTLANAAVTSQVFDRYSRVLDSFYAADEQVVAEIDDPTVRRGSELALLALRQGDLTATIVRDLTMAMAGGAHPDGLNTRDEIIRVASLLRLLRTNEQDIRTVSQGPFRPHVERLVTSDEVRLLPGLVDQAIATGRTDMGRVLTATTRHTGDSAYARFRKAVVGSLRDHAHRWERSATAEAWALGAMAVVSTAAAVAITLVVARSITRPLESLTGQARDMAERQLPDGVRAVLETRLGQDVTVPEIEPISVRTRDEVIEVAQALTTVQGTALGLAVEQAVLRRNLADSFLNMGRRNQNLLQRQLEFITELESGETDPEILANLFRLDHLATRMRRNAESLLVLAGVERPRPWAAPVSGRDLVRAALSEVEDFRRVTAIRVSPADVAGAAASDLAHALAELIENALIHSPHGAGVEVLGAPGGESYRLAIVDNGPGMTPADLARANARLSGTESYTVAPSRYLGHYVAGRLAARHGVRVWLQPSPVQGVTAVLDFPPGLVTPAGRPVAFTGHHPDFPAGARPTPALPNAALPPAAPVGGPPGRQ